MKITICKWLPASWKSTWAKEQVEKSWKNIIRVNKDDLREMLWGYSKPNEELVLDVRDYIITHAIVTNRNIIIDDTNLDPKHEARIRELAFSDTQIEIKEFRTSLEECIERDSKRQNPVGEKVIREMNDRYKWITPSTQFSPVIQNTRLPKVYIVDIDWTVALMNGRSPYDYSKVSEDIPNKPVIQTIQTLAEGTIDLIFVSGRPDSCQEDTYKWLEDNIWPYNFKLYMRETWDNRSDDIVKREILEKYILDTNYVLWVFDDRDRVVKMWRESGLTCFQVAEGNF